jgi:hypothetical protein
MVYDGIDNPTYWSCYTGADGYCCTNADTCTCCYAYARADAYAYARADAYAHADTASGVNGYADASTV